MDIEKLKERIAARKALGLSADEYNRQLAYEEAVRKAKARVLFRAAIRKAIYVGIHGDDVAIDAAIQDLENLKGV